MIYISIPVHEKPDVIIDQAKNFERFFPNAIIMLHLSKNAVFSINALQQELEKGGVSNVLINPVQVETKWGDIIQAHIENIRYILSLGNANKVIFHSSNDMLVMNGVEDYIQNKNYLFHQRKCRDDSYWWVSRKAVNDNKNRDYWGDNIYASQIEGSMYNISLLKELMKEIDNGILKIDGNSIYPREEIIFSSFAYKKGIKNDGLPYVYSEVHQFDRKFFSYIKRFKFFLTSSLIVSRGLRWLLSKYLESLNFYRINDNIILKIRNRVELDNQNYLCDGCGLKWIIFEKNSLFGVKRIERKINNPVRRFIRDKLM